jgi:hypothetical protein
MSTNFEASRTGFSSFASNQTEVDSLDSTSLIISKVLYPEVPKCRQWNATCISFHHERP